MTRLDDLEEEANRFFRLTDVEEGQSYFGPKNGVYTALGLKEAYTFLAGVAAG